MRKIKRFINDFRKYFRYAIFSAKAELKTEVANSYLNWIWWILEPICMMFIYIFVVEIVFKSKEPNFPIFVFIGITAWTYFDKMIITSVKLMKNKKNIITNIYVPKYVFVMEKSFIYSFKAFISFGIILVLMLLFKVNYSLYLLLFIPYYLLLYIITFGICCIIMHFGTYVEDLNNISTIMLKFLLYFSGIFYSIETRIPQPLNNILLATNPIAFIIDSFRKIFLYGQVANFWLLLAWYIIGLLICYIGIKLIYKYEKNYIKVI